MPLDMALTAAKAFEAECEIALEDLLDARRAKERARQAKHRAKVNGNNVMSRDETLDDVKPRDLTSERTQVVNPFSSSLRSEEVGGGGGEREREIILPDDWPEAKDLAKLLIETVASPRLDPDKSLGLPLTAGRLTAWRQAGASWEFDVVPVVTALCAKQRTLVSTWKFFDAAIARSIADNRAALEIPEAGRAHRSTGPPQSLAQTIAAESAEARRRVLES